MAPAAKLSSQGRAGTTRLAARMVNRAAMGSTAPDSTPSRKARPLPAPSARRGMDTMAPSGKFWMAMPRDRARAPARVTSPSPASQAA